MRSRLRRTAASLITKGQFQADVEEILAALETDEPMPISPRLDDVLASATARIPYYSRARPRLSTLTDFPVLDKVTMKDSLSDFIDPDVRRGDLKTRSTSGSTGIPFTVYMEPERSRRNQAGAAASLKYAGGDPFAPFVRARAWAKLKAKDRLLNYLKEYYAYNGDHFRSDGVLPIGTWIKKRRGTVVQGYSSYLEQMFRVFEEVGIGFEPGEVDAVVGGAEAPTPYLFAASQRIFGVTAHVRYSNMELGVMSTSSRHAPDVYKVDCSTFHVEILEEYSEEPVPAGELGRVVVTDLHNKVMPLIRYDTGDLGRFAQSSKGDYLSHQVTDIRGRRLDVLVGGTIADPHRTHPLSVWGPVAAIGVIRQFQLRQHDVGRFTWVLNADRSAALEHRLRGILDERVGDIAFCGFEYVTDVPVLASGKRQFFINEIDDPLAFIESSKQS